MSLNREEVVEIVRSLHLPQGSFVVFGSGPLARVNIRKTGDVDLMVSERLFKELQALDGWKTKALESGGEALTNGDVEIFMDWKFRGYNPRFEDLKATADTYRGIPFVNLHEVRKWKSHMNRPKDRHDVEMIDNYLAHHG